MLIDAEPDFDATFGKAADTTGTLYENNTCDFETKGGSNT
jgi:hypothetical protein